MIILNTVRKKTNIYHLHVGSKTNDSNDLIYKTEIGPQTQKTNLATKRERG